MNVSIRIGDETRPFASATKEWINKLFAFSRQRGLLPAVVVEINTPGLYLGLATPGAGRGGGGGGAFTLAQDRIVESWMHHHMSSSHYTGGNLIAFLGDLEKLLAS